MAWNPSPKVADLRDYAHKHNKTKVILLAIDANGSIEGVSYGLTKLMCDEAKELMDIAFDAVMQHFEDEEDRD